MVLRNACTAAGSALLLTLALGAGIGGCTGAEEDIEAAPEVASTYPTDLLDRSWAVQTGDSEVRQPYEGTPGWIELVVKRDLASAARGLGPAGGSAAARAHAEAASMYRQAALLSANSLISAWGNMAEETDPAGAAHLLTVSYILAGDLAKAREYSAKLPADSPASAWHGPWKTWLAGDATWPPDLSGLPIELPEKTAGTWPELPDPPHYELKEQTEDARSVLVGDLSALVALALWHDAVAQAADAKGASLYAVQYRFPGEPARSGDTLGLDYTFGSDYLVGEDAGFLAALGKDGVAAVEPWSKKSLLAALVIRARTEGKIDPERAIDLASETRSLTLERLKERAGGNTEGFHRTFADIARVGVLRGLALVAEAEGDREVSGRLRILALESSGEEWTADPSALLSMAAWDASNEYPVRATETLHNLIRRFPSLETARFGVDVLALRVSRRRGGGAPGQ